MNILRRAGATVAFLIALSGLWYSHTSFANPPPKPAKPAASASTAARAETPEEAKKRKDWNEQMLRKPTPKQGCFRSDYPATEWREIKCVPAPPHPAIPKAWPPTGTVGNTSGDVAAQAPSGHISQAIGGFDTVTNVTSESGPVANTGPPVADAFSLQINTNPFVSTVCNGSPTAACSNNGNSGCCGWQQFVFANPNSTGNQTATLFIQDWIEHYDTNCPANQNWTQFPYDGGIYCYQNVKTSSPGDQGATPVDNQAITNLANLRLTASVSSTGDTVTLTTGTSAYSRTVSSLVDAAGGWTIAEFNIFGDLGNSAGGGMASFNSGASIATRTEIIYGGTAAPTCVAQSYTGETNNLSFGSTAPAATAPGPAVIFTESIAGGATSSCAAAATIGDTHLATFNMDFAQGGPHSQAQQDRSVANTLKTSARRASSGDLHDSRSQRAEHLAGATGRSSPQTSQTQEEGRARARPRASRPSRRAYAGEAAGLQQGTAGRPRRPTGGWESAQAPRSAP